jgi:bifunctional ADP-heptose synthase (sugar kinase/adenylyltransferase)
MTATDKLSRVHVLCIGDVMLDRFVSGQVVNEISYDRY